jgi:hypothetical protein
MRPIGVIEANRARSAAASPPAMVSNASVAVGPGATALTVMPRSARSTARKRTAASIAPLASASGA